MRMCLVCALVMMGTLGCSGDDSSNTPYAPDRDGGRPSTDGNDCTDVDDDGFCAADDCDDNDPDVAELCCVEGGDPMTDCPCIEGTESVWCDPSQVADKRSTQGGVQGVQHCMESAMFCRDQKWSDCEGVGWIFEAS